MNRKVTRPAHRTTRSLAAFTGALVLGLLSACDTGSTTPQEGGSTGTPGSPETAAAEPTAVGVLTRVRDRWDLICRASEDSKLWIEVYDFEAPATREAVSLVSFLSNKQDFHYDQPSEPKLLLLEDDLAYVNLSVVWLSGLHPKIGDVQGVIGADRNRVDFLDIVETWKFVDGEWYMAAPPERRDEFLEANPDVLRRAQRANEEEDVAEVPAPTEAEDSEESPR